mmetsp:Transcript_5234/g.10264  ORF Transcript_5234/g.10264 Transcript_5234/m.10264 type:complete len:260 (+) Transcript_5234:140-919(+)
MRRDQASCFSFGFACGGAASPCCQPVTCSYKVCVMSVMRRRSPILSTSISLRFSSVRLKSTSPCTRCSTKISMYSSSPTAFSTLHTSFTVQDVGCKERPSLRRGGTGWVASCTPIAADQATMSSYSCVSRSMKYSRSPTTVRPNSRKWSSVRRKTVPPLMLWSRKAGTMCPRPSASSHVPSCSPSHTSTFLGRPSILRSGRPRTDARFAAMLLQLRSYSYRSLSPHSMKPRKTFRPEMPSPLGHSCRCSSCCPANFMPR